MILGQRIKQARLEAGLSQRQLCGEEVTRNMLSQIENGAAQPSMTTLAYFASRLGKPVSYFLDEEAVCSPNQEIMDRAREAVLGGKPDAALEMLCDYRKPDEIFDAEFQLLHRLAALASAEEAAARGQVAYAAQLLEELGRIEGGYCPEELERRRLLCLAKVRPQLRGDICRNLPCRDEEMLLRARDTLDRGELDRAAAFLETADNHNGAEWNFLMGEVYIARGKFAEAAACYHKAEDVFPEKSALRLEHCDRELENFKQAYFYACKQR